MDKNYWANFYAKHKVGEKPSLFAKFVWENYLSTRQDLRLIELGCGNGRDALYFAKQGIQTTAIDQVQEEVSYLATHCATTKNGIVNPRFIAGDFTNLNEIFRNLTPHSNNTQSRGIIFDCIYSRFTLHSITHTQQESLLSQIPNFIAPNGILAIEARGKKNSLYKQGEPIENEANAFIHDNHYRRFVDFDNLCEIVESQLNLEILFAKEDRGFAPFNGEDDYFFRIVGITHHERERERVKKREISFVLFASVTNFDENKLGTNYVAA